MVNLLCGHSEPFSQTWPASGSMRSGRAWERPTSAPPTSAAACFSSPGLPTPRARDWKRGGKDGLEEALLPTPRTPDTNGAGLHGSGGPDLRTAVSLLPTPRASDGSKGGPNQRGSSGDLTLPSAAVRLLPTPAASNPNDGEDLESWEARRQRNLAKKTNGNGQGTPLGIAVRLLPTPTAQAHSRNSTANRTDPKPSTNTQSQTLLDVFWTGETTDRPSNGGSGS